MGGLYGGRREQTGIERRCAYDSSFAWETRSDVLSTGGGSHEMRGEWDEAS